MKKCRKCKEEKPLEAFGKNKVSKDGLAYICKECAREKLRRWRQANPDKVIEANRKWQKENSSSDKRKRYLREWQSANPDKRKETYRKWRRNNPEKIYENSSNSRAQRRAAVGNDKLPRGFMVAMISVYGNTCLFPGCKSTDLTFDHVVPLSKNGRHTLENGQLLCKSHNSSKGNRSTADYRNHRTGILVGLFGNEPMLLKRDSKKGWTT